MKATPKSCSCSQCKAGKGRIGGNFFMKYDERAFRHQQKQALKSGAEVVGIAPKGNRYD